MPAMELIVEQIPADKLKDLITFLFSTVMRYINVAIVHQRIDITQNINVAILRLVPSDST